MIKKIKITSRAEKDIAKAEIFYINLYGKKKTLEIMDVVFDAIYILESDQVDLEKIGSIDDTFSNFKREYRKIFQKHFKITYRIGNSAIYVTRVFDTRQNPKKNL